MKKIMIEYCYRMAGILTGRKASCRQVMQKEKIPSKMRIYLKIKRKRVEAEKGKKTTSKSKEDSKAKQAKDWTDEETSLLIDHLESKPYLWDVHYGDYSKRDIKEIAYKEMA